MKNKIILGIIFLILAIYSTMLYHQYKYFNHAVKLEKKERLIFAVDYYSYVIIAYVPFSPYIMKAEKKILDIGKKLYKNNDLYGSLFAYEVLRSSYFQVRSFYQPREKLIEKLNYKIAEIKVEILKNENRLKNAKEEYGRQLKILQHNDFPSNIASFIMCFSFFAWIASIVFMILKGFKKEKADRKIIFLSLGGYIIFFTVWVISLYLV